MNKLVLKDTNSICILQDLKMKLHKPADQPLSVTIFNNALQKESVLFKILHYLFHRMGIWLAS